LSERLGENAALVRAAMVRSDLAGLAFLDLEACMGESEKWAEQSRAAELERPLGQARVRIVGAYSER